MKLLTPILLALIAFPAAAQDARVTMVPAKDGKSVDLSLIHISEPTRPY